ncbi:MAG: hypothetical protein IPP49_20195 [Saprospiraceae bacterium]|nr:hypothetical protein [Saprospiraceae bacterium]
MFIHTHNRYTLEFNSGISLADWVHQRGNSSTDSSLFQNCKVINASVIRDGASKTEPNISHRLYWFCLPVTRMPEDTVKENFHTSGSSIFGKRPVRGCSSSYSAATAALSILSVPVPSSLPQSQYIRALDQASALSCLFSALSSAYRTELLGGQDTISGPQMRY